MTTGYARRVQAAIASGAIPAAPGTVTTITIEHGPGCHAPTGGPCTCHPCITATVGDDVLTIGTGGAILERRRKQ